MDPLARSKLRLETLHVTEGEKLKLCDFIKKNGKASDVRFCRNDNGKLTLSWDSADGTREFKTLR